MTEAELRQRAPIPYIGITLALLVIFLGWYFSRSAAPVASTPPAGPIVGVNTPGWPLSIQEGVLQCVGSAVTVQAPDGTVYAINGNARNQAQSRGWRDASGVQTGDVGPLIQQGLALCD